MYFYCIRCLIFLSHRFLTGQQAKTEFHLFHFSHRHYQNFHFPNLKTWWLNQSLWSSTLFSAGSFGISRGYDTENNIPLGAAVLNGTGRHITRYEWQHMSPCTTGKEYRHFLRTFQVLSGEIFAPGSKKIDNSGSYKALFWATAGSFLVQNGFLYPQNTALAM